MGVGRGHRIIEPPVQGAGLPVVVARVVVAAQAGVGQVKGPVDAGLPRLILFSVRCRQGGVQAAHLVPPETGPFQIGAEGPGDPPGVAAEPVLGRRLDDRQQNPVLVPDPGPGLVCVGQRLRLYTRAGITSRGRLQVRVHQQRGRARGVQVMIEHPLPGRPLLLLARRFGALLAGVAAKQVMAGVPARGRLREQASPGQCSTRAFFAA